MPRKRKPTVDDLHDRRYGKSPVSDNTPESSSLTQDERAYIEAGLSALALLRKTFESWIAVGRAIQTLRAKADLIRTRQAFNRLLDQQGFGEFIKDKATCTRLLRIMENLGEVSKWHAELEPKEQKAWAHPSTVFLRCPVFQKDGASKPRPQPAKPENLTKVMEQKDARNAELQEEIENFHHEKKMNRVEISNLQGEIAVLQGEIDALKARGPAEQSTPTYDQAVDIVAARLGAMPQAKMLEAMKAIHNRIAAARVENTERKRAPKKSKGVKGVGLNFGEALTDAIDKLARESSR
jgi:hypothetical protein